MSINIPRVVNVELDENKFFIGRPSKLSNPYKIGEDKYTRKQALENTTSGSWGRISRWSKYISLKVKS